MDRSTQPSSTRIMLEDKEASKFWSECVSSGETAVVQVPLDLFVESVAFWIMRSYQLSVPDNLSVILEAAMGRERGGRVSLVVAYENIPHTPYPPSLFVRHRWSDKDCHDAAVSRFPEAIRGVPGLAVARSLCS